jgi:hypothetical protein
MAERVRNFLYQFALPILVFISALSVAQYQLTQKETIEKHNADIQRLESKQEATYSLLLDVACRQEPLDRRCK